MAESNDQPSLYDRSIKRYLLPVTILVGGLITQGCSGFGNKSDSTPPLESYIENLEMTSRAKNPHVQFLITKDEKTGRIDYDVADGLDHIVGQVTADGSRIMDVKYHLIHNIPVGFEFHDEDVKKHVLYASANLSLEDPQLTEISIEKAVDHYFTLQKNSTDDIESSKIAGALNDKRKRMEKEHAKQISESGNGSIIPYTQSSTGTNPVAPSNQESLGEKVADRLIDAGNGALDVGRSVYHIVFD